jgi:predicted XRE-type DNA-binding protein
MLALQYSLMIALLRGVLIEKHPNQAMVDVGGVGYDVTIPVSTYAHLPDAGAEVRLRIHTHVREDALALFGFLTQDEKALFEKLISVSDMMIALSSYIQDRKISQAGAARIMGVSQLRISALMRGKIGSFTLDALVNMLTSAGLKVDMHIRPGRPRGKKVA